MRIFIASADRAFRLALLLLLESEPGMVVIGMSDRAEELATLVGASQPEALLLDDGLTKQATADLVGAVHHLDRPPKVIVLSGNPLVKEVVLAAGADGFIYKNVPSDELLPILRSMR